MLSFHNLARVSQTGHLMYEVSADCMNVGYLSHKRIIVQ